MRFKVSRLVLSTFDREPKIDEQACHNDGDKTNNSINNLRWATRSENMADCKKHGTDNRGENHWNALLNEQQVREIKSKLNSGQVQRNIAREYDVHEVTIWRIKKGLNWVHVS